MQVTLRIREKTIEEAQMQRDAYEESQPNSDFTHAERPSFSFDHNAKNLVVNGRRILAENDSLAPERRANRKLTGQAEYRAQVPYSGPMGL
jgi:hypothetical protein